MNFGIDGKVALVAASTSGLGLASAQALSLEGARVAISGRRGDVARSQAALLKGAVGFEMDLAIEGNAHELATKVAKEMGSVEILVLNSGGPKPGPAAKMTRAAFLEAAEYLIFQHIELVNAILPDMISKKWGRIIGIGSTAIQNPNPDLSLSSIARSSLAAYLKTLSKEVAAEGVTVNMVHPGRVDTERVRQLDRFKAEKENRPVAEIERDSIGTIPANRYGHPEEFGSTVAFLASKQASYITGVQVRVDGGRVEGY